MVFHDLIFTMFHVGVEGGYIELQEVTRGYRRLLGVAGGYKRLQKTCFLSRTSPDTSSRSIGQENIS